MITKRNNSLVAKLNNSSISFESYEIFFTDIITENRSAMRNDLGEWEGSLAQLGWQHLWGYWVYVTEAVEFNFNVTDNLPKFVSNEIPDYNIENYPFMIRYKQSQKQSFY